MAVAYCWATGEIGIGEEVPDGTLTIIEGEWQELHDLMGVVARHAYDGETLLVPGVPEAPDQSDALHALIIWRHWVHDRHQAKGAA